MPSENGNATKRHALQPQPMPVVVKVDAIEHSEEGFLIMFQFNSVNGTNVYFIGADEAVQIAEAVKDCASRRPIRNA